MRLPCRCLAWVVVLVFLSSLTQAQQPASRAQTEEQVGEGEVVRVTSNLVTVPVSVMNRQGQYVVDLAQKDFRIYENGIEQSIAHFANVDQPYSVVLLIDTSGSTAPFLAAIKEAAEAFVTQLRPADRARLVYFHGEIKPLNAAGISDQNELSAAIDRIESGPINMGTRLFDAVDFGLNELKSERRRTAIILLTDGENTWGKATMKGTLHEAEESDTVIYTVQ
jgi:Ca-activated chloride channel homolog